MNPNRDGWRPSIDIARGSAADCEGLVRLGLAGSRYDAPDDEGFERPAPGRSALTMHSELTYRTMTDADRPNVARLMGLSFGATPEQIDRWLASAGLDIVRVVHRTGEQPTACLLLPDIGQYFGGRAVSMVGIAGVAVAPEARGRGVGTHMMRSTVLELHQRGVALSALYPATQPIYRRVGFEQAGYSCLHRIDVSKINPNREDRALPIRPVADADDPRIEAAYREHVPACHGAAERRTYIWPRVRVWRGDPATGWVIDVDGRIEGWVYLLQRDASPPAPSMRRELFLTDIQALTPRASRRLLAFLADFDSMVDFAKFIAGPHHPLYLMLPEQTWAGPVQTEYWMLRVLDVRRALEDRGYAPGLSARVALDIDDDLIESNRGAFTLEVENGRGRVSAGKGGGAPALTLHVRDLAPLYSGFLTPWALARLGRVSGDAEALAAAGAVFAGGPPSLFERF